MNNSKAEQKKDRKIFARFAAKTGLQKIALQPTITNNHILLDLKEFFKNIENNNG